MFFTKRKGIIDVILLAVFLIGESSISNAQDYYKQLINVAIGSGRVVYIQPLKKIDITRDEIEMQITGYIRELKEKVDTGILFELAEKSSNLDTSLWKYDEIDSSILATREYAELSLDSIIGQKKVKGRKQINFYKKIIKEYNSQSPKKRVPLAYSRPVFDRMKTYAIVGFQGRGGYGTAIYHLKGKKWVELGIVTRWIID
jgi:hypothetical protein